MNVIERNYTLKIERLLKDMEAIADNEYFYNNRDKLISSLIDVVHAIADCYVRNKCHLTGTNKEFVLAFCYLNNQLKHDTKLEVFSIQIYSAVLPTRLPCLLDADCCSLLWANFEDHGSTRAEGKREHYDTYLNGKDVEETLCKVKTILDGVIAQRC